MTPGSRITPFNVIEIALYDDGTTPEVVQNPDGPALGYPVPRTYVARAGGKGKRSTTLAEMQAYDGGRYKNAILRQTKQYFNIYHNIAPAKEALQCNDCHTAAGGPPRFCTAWIRRRPNRRALRRTIGKRGLERCDEVRLPPATRPDEPPARIGAKHAEEPQPGRVELPG